MAKAVTIAFLAVLVASSAFGQAGTIGIFADPNGTNPNLVDNGPGIYSVYVVHVDVSGSEGCQFSAPLPACYPGSFLSDGNVHDVVLGNSQDGVSVAYGQCLSGPIHVLTINVFNQGLTQQCCRWWVRPHPDNVNQQIEATNCSRDFIYPLGAPGTFNADAGCGDPYEESTWGRVKKLYDE